MAYILKEWYLKERMGKDQERSLSVVGYVYGRPGWKDGKKLRSSEIRDTEHNNGLIRIQTLNSEYLCAEDNHRFPVRDTEIIQKLFELEAEQRITAAAQVQFERAKQELFDKLPAEAGKGLLLVMTDTVDYYFDAAVTLIEGRKEYRRDHHIHVGMLQDSVLIGDMETLDFRFFPYKGNRLKFYAWDGEYEPVYLFNKGLDPLEVDCPYGSFLVKPCTVELLDNCNTDAKINKHIAPTIDKYSLLDAEIDENGNVSYR